MTGFNPRMCSVAGGMAFLAAAYIAFSLAYASVRNMCTHRHGAHEVPAQQDLLPSPIDSFTLRLHACAAAQARDIDSSSVWCHSASVLVCQHGDMPLARANLINFCCCLHVPIEEVQW